LALMRNHSGMRPQDVPILLKIIAKGIEPWQNKDLAAELYFSASEISESLNRSLFARLIDFEKRGCIDLPYQSLSNSGYCMYFLLTQVLL
jgi:hypothetical protein